MRGALVVLSLCLAACASPRDDPQAPATIVGHEPAPSPASVRDVIRAEANRLYGPDCGRVVLPDRAFEPVEITGGGLPEYVVLFGRGVCASAGSASVWTGSGGAMVQVWLASGGPPRMLLEHQMHGFSVVPRGFLSLQHGGFCPGGAGPGVCLVQYEWNEKDRALEVAHRQYYGDGNPGRPPTMNYDYETISR